MALLLIRHGETDLNATRVVQFPDTPLGADGKRQAEQLGLSLGRRSIGLVLSSDYLRARMTAERISAHTSAPLLKYNDLRERNFGELRGTSYEALGDLDIFALDYVPPGGESWAVFNARVDRAWRTVLGHAAGMRDDLAVVTHGLVLRSLLERVLDVSNHVLLADLVVANTSVTIVDHAPPWRVLDLASTAHLSDGARAGGPV